MAAAIALAATAMLSAAHSQQPLLSHVRSWAYQLQALDPLEIAQSLYDVVVLDYAMQKDSVRAMPPEIIDIMRRKPDGSRRFILAYLSIGEAESFRYYWRKAWTKERPDWLEKENPHWPGNYTVKYWDPDWQAILFGTPDAYLDQILDAGFDGVYLDGVDVFERHRGRPDAMADMVDLVAKVAAYARSRRKDFLIVPQNGERILGDPRMLDIIDAFAREDLLYNENRSNTPNREHDIEETVATLKTVTRVGKPVLVVEYVRDHELAADLLREIASFGFIGYVARRDLRGLDVLDKPPPCREAARQFSLSCLFSGCAPPGCSR